MMSVREFLRTIPMRFRRSARRRSWRPVDDVRQIERFEPRCLLAGVTGGAPSLLITKGIVSTTDGGAIFDTAVGPSGVSFAAPQSAELPFSSAITSEGIRSGAAAVAVNANLANARPGDAVRFAVIVENQSSLGAAFDVTIGDALPSGVTYVPGSLQVLSGNGQALTYVDLAGATDGSGLFSTGVRLDDPGVTTGTLANVTHCGALDALTTGQSGNNIAVLIYDVQVGNPAGNTATFSSDATLLSFAQTEGGSNLSTSSSDIASLTLERIDLEITKSVSTPSPIIGDIVTWTIDVLNNASTATAPATGVVVADVVPAGQSIVAGSASFATGDSFNETTATWTLGGSLAPGATRQLTVQTVAARSVALASDFVDIEVDAQFERTTVSEGDTVRYTVTASNSAEGSTISATGLTIDGLLPAGLTLISAAPSVGTFDSTSGTWDLTTTPLPRGSSAILTIDAAVGTGTAGSSITFASEVATLNETDVDATPSNSSTTEDDDFQQTLIVQANATTRTVTGRAFLDVNNDGSNSGETGVAGITVNAYSPTGTLAGTTTTDANGLYSLTGVTSEALRLEFVGFSSNQSVTTAQSPPAASSTFSSLAFLDAGTSSVTANLALYLPKDTAQFITTCFVYSGQSTLDVTTEPAVIAFNADGSIKTTLATIAEVGATNGLALHRFSGDQFAAAFHKRHADIGPAGNSAIYRIDAAGGVSTFLRLDDIFGAGFSGANSHDPANWFTDAPAFGQSGRISLGDLDISEDGQFLYTVNLATQELIQIPVGSGLATDPTDYVVGDTRVVSRFSILGNDPTTPTNGGIPTGLLGVDPAANIRPFALSIRNGLVYVGMVNSAETTTFTSDLNAYVFTFDPATGRFSSSASVSFPLGTRTTGGGWQAWTSDWDELPKFYEPAGDFFSVGRNQPWLTDIEFDNNGDMILGFRDRTGDEVGHMVGDPTGADTDGIGGPDRFYHDTKGDILRLRRTSAATWSPEIGHTAGDGTEYYAGDEASFEAIAAVLHPESAQGGLTQISGSNDIFTTAIDPESFWAGGVIALDNATGEQTDQLDVYSGSEAADIVTFGKNNGLGDLEFFNNLSHEIGNRIWNDVNGNGVQDAGEPALSNVDLQLIDISDPAVPLIVGTTATNADGEYYFNDSNVSYSDGGDQAGLRSLTDYRVQVVPTEFQPGGTLFGFLTTKALQAPILQPRTIQNVTGSAEFDSDLNLTADTPRNQRFDLLSATGFRADGVEVVVTNITGGFARVESDQSVVFEFLDGVTSGSFEYVIIDGRLDSNAFALDSDDDTIPDEAFATFRTGAAGWTDHSVDLGFRQANVDLQLSKSVDRQRVVENDAVTFTVVVTNSRTTAELAATGVSVTDVLPVGLTRIPGSIVASQGTFDGTTWTLTTPLLPGDSATLSYRATVNPATAGSIITNVAEISSLTQSDFDSTASNDDGDRSEDDEDDAIIFVGTSTNATVVNRAQVIAADQVDFDSTANNDDHDSSEDDESAATYTLSTLTNVFDFGDLPDVYRTTSANGGPSHRRGTPTFLGVSVDDEIDGLPTPTASGDGIDEDGIRFLTPLIPGTTASVEVTASTDGFLNAWIDFDSDNTLDELQITTIDGVSTGTPVAANDLPLTAGVHVLSIDVPTTAAGDLAARFRYTNDAMAALRSTGGPWLNGEVEDYVLREIGDRVWFDHDRDGGLDPVTEAGLAGVTVILSTDLDGDGTNETYTTITDINGFYRFIGLPEGDYTVSVSPPATLVATFDSDGGNDNTTALSITPADPSRSDVDFGYRGIGLIGDRVWIDTNANGLLDGSESGLSGVNVVLTGDLNGNGLTDITHTTTTDASGLYEFPELVAGDYTVTVTSPTGADPTFDADNISTPNQSQLSLAIGTVNRSQDFGYRGNLSLGDTIWLDTDADGTVDLGEPRLGGFSVQLSGDINGDSVADITATTTTDVAGQYLFPNLLPGIYTVTVVPPSGYEPTFDVDGIGTLNVATVTLTAPNSDLNVDFGYRGNGLLGDTVWVDSNGDGIQDTGETGIAGATIQLLGDINGDTIPDLSRSTVTATGGNYEFANLPPGDYTITVAQPADTTPSFDSDGTATPGSTRVTLAAGQTDRTHDFGYQPTSTGGPTGLIGDTIWEDSNGDGIQNTGETGLTGIVVQLAGDTNGDSVSDVTLSTTTNATGVYEFPGLAAGTYTITVVPPSGATATFDSDGTATLNTAVVILAANAQDRTLDFGYQTGSGTGADVDLAVQKESDAAGDTAAMGSSVVYSVRVTNNGPGDAVDATLSDILPAAFAAATWTATGSTGTVFAAAGTGSLAETISVPAGGFVTYTVTAVLDAAFAGSVSNTASVATPQTDSDTSNNQSTDTLQVTPLTLTPETDPLPGKPFQIGARGMSHVSLVPFVVGTTPGTGTINGVTVDIADPQIFMVGFVCVDDRIIAVYDIPENVDGETLYFQAYETTPVPRVSNRIEAIVGSARIFAQETGNVTAVTEGSTSDSVRISLSEQPSTDVTIDIQNERPDRVVVSESALTFTPANWNVPQALNLSAVDDGRVNGDIKANVVLKVRSGSDAAFETAFSKSLRVSVNDNDVLQTPGLTNSHTTTTDQQPLITWSAVPDADSYDIWISPSHDVANPSDNTNVRGTSFTPSEPLSIGRHAVWVRARTDSGLVSAWSEAATIDITTAPVVSVSSLTSEFRTTISWPAISGATQYEVWVNNTTAGVSKAVYAAQLTYTSLTTAALQLGVHSIWVRGINSSGRPGGWSTVTRLTVGPAPLTPGSTFNRQPEFTWSSPAGAETFEIYLQAGSSIVRQAGLTNPSYTPIIPLNNNTDYRWWVRGFTPNGTPSPWSGPATARIGGRPTTLSPTVGETTSTAPTFRWEAVDGAVAYDLFVFRVDDSAVAFRIPTATTNEYTHTSIIPAGNYRVWVRAISGAGVFSPWSTLVEFSVA